jgi:hypothetical protein
MEWKVPVMAVFELPSTGVDPSITVPRLLAHEHALSHLSSTGKFQRRDQIFGLGDEPHGLKRGRRRHAAVGDEDAASREVSAARSVFADHIMLISSALRAAEAAGPTLPATASSRCSSLRTA